MKKAAPVKSLKITRRTFLKTAAGSAIGTAAAANLSCTPRAASTGVNTGVVKKIPTQCHGCGANRCGIFASVKNGRVWKIEGNPKTYNNQGYVCPRGHAYIRELYDPRRIKQPLKRNADGSFTPISWEQAFKEITVKLNLLIMNEGPQSVFWLHYPMSNAALAFRFMHALGSPNIMSHGSTCYTARNAAFSMTYGGLPAIDLKNSSYILIIGRNPCGGIKLQQMKDLMEAKDKGAKLVVVDPRHNETALVAHDWLAIKPGTDLALLLSMMNVIVAENLYDSEFIKSRTVGFDEFRDALVAYPPEWAEKVCDIFKETIYRIAREMAAHKPGALVHRGYHGAFGAGYLNSFQTARAVALLNALLGNMGAKGGLYMPYRPTLGSLKDGGHPSPNIPTVQKADGSGIPGRYPAGSYSDGITHAIPELALTGELKAGFVHHSNPARTNPNPARVIAGYRKLDLLVVVDCFMSETASLAHYVLPESFFLERDDVVDTVHSSGVGQLTLLQQVIKPLHDTKPLLDILKGLAPGLGIGRFFNFTMDEVNRLYLKPLDIDLETLKRDGVADVGQHPSEGFKPLETPSGKVEFYSNRLKDWGVDPFPVWQEPLTAIDPNDPHSFRLLHGKQAVQTNSMTISSPVLNDLAVREKMTRLWINRARAQRLDIADGDLVFIESDMCRGRIAVRLTDGLHPDAVWLPSGYGGFSKHLTNAFGLGLSYNDFCPTRFDPVVGHAMTSEIIVKIVKADG